MSIDPEANISFILLHLHEVKFVHHGYEKAYCLAFCENQLFEFYRSLSNIWVLSQFN